MTSLRRAAAAAVVLGSLLAVTACGTRVDGDSSRSAGGASGSLAVPDSVTSSGDDGAPGAPPGDSDGDLGGGTTSATSGGGGTTGEAGTSSGDPTDASGTPDGPGDDQGSEGSDAGGDDTRTGTLRLGVLGYRDSGTNPLGITGPDLGALDVWVALAETYNAAGGLAGRRVEVVPYYLDPNALNFATDYQAACSMFTEDDHVDLVASIALNDVGFERCLTGAGVPHVHGGPVTLGDDELARNPSLVYPDGATTQRRWAAALDGFLASGRLSRGDRLGVMVDGCPASVDTFESVIVPAAQRAGVALDRFDTACAVGFADAGGASADAGAAVLRFRASGVDSVAFVSNYESVLLLFLSQSASSQGWRPEYALTSVSAVAGLAPQLPADQLGGMAVAGTWPLADQTVVPRSATDDRCYEMGREGGLDASAESGAGPVTVQPVCATMFLIEAALRRSRGRTDPASWAAAVAGLGVRVRLPSLVGDVGSFGAGRRDGASRLQTTRYETGCGCFRSFGPERALSRRPSASAGRRGL